MCGRRVLAAGALAVFATAHGSAAELPPEGDCGGAPSAVAGERVDATRAPLRSGDVITHGDLAALRSLLPSEVWAHRDAFFFDGMRLTIGACHRRYAASASYAAASREQRGRARLDAAGNLVDDASGLPFAPESIDGASPDAGARWAWNLERRHRAAGPTGSFRIVDFPDARFLADHTAPQVYEGEFFFLDSRAASAGAGTIHALRDNAWIAGGSFREPPAARHLAWRQFRPLPTATDPRMADDVFVYLPDLRKLRRGAGARADGVFVPRYRSAGGGNARALPYGQGGRAAVIEAGHGRALAVAEDIDRGFTGLALRPNAWTWRVVAEREVLAPLNARVEGWPLRANRNHGPSGLSLASDTWDLRWAVVIEGRARGDPLRLPRVTYWIDAQTVQPLYVMRRAAGGALREVGVLAHRYSGDVPGYPVPASGEPVNAFDPVAAAFLALPSGGWRRESWDARSLPLEPRALRERLSTDALVRGR